MNPKILVLGIGNILLSDEGCGVHVVNYLARHFPLPPEVTCLDGGTLSFTLAPEIEDAHGFIVADAAELRAEPGSLCCLENEAMDEFLSKGKRGVHEVGLLDLLHIARLNGCLPPRRALFAIQPQTLGWGEYPSPTVAEVIPRAARQIHELIQCWRQGG